MPRIVREAIVRAAPERIFHLLADPTERAKWLVSMKESAIEGPLQVGTRIPARRSAVTSRSTYEIVVTRLDAPNAIETDVRRNGSHAGKGGYELAAVPEGTRVRAYGEFELTGLQRMMTPMVAAGMEREIDSDLASLKRAAEAAPPP